jgi:hypothetical protein
MNLKTIAIGLALVGFVYWWTHRNKYAGLVSAGWGGNTWNNLPGLINPSAVVGYGMGSNRPVYGPPNPGGMTGQPDLGTLN